MATILQKKALVIHPRFYVYGGGELLSLHVMKTLLENGYETWLASDTYDPETVERIYQFGNVLKRVRHIPIPPFNPVLPRFLAFQRLFYARTIRNFLDRDWNIVFSTQSSVFSIKTAPLYHFIYDIVDTFSYPSIPFIAKHGIPALGGSGLAWKAYYFLLKQARKLVLSGDPKPKAFYALSEKIRGDLERNGFANARTIYPPCSLEFQPCQKKKRVVQVTRLVPQKRLEWFMQIARRLPQYRFLIVGRDNPILQRLNPGYAEKLLASKPGNVEYVEAAIRERPELVEESKVYLYTGIEPGLGIALMEAMGAGCIPVCPFEGGGGEVVRASKVGFQYRSLDEAVTLVRNALEDNYSGHRPDYIREQAKMFSVEAFQEKIRSLL